MQVRLNDQIIVMYLVICEPKYVRRQDITQSVSVVQAVLTHVFNQQQAPLWWDYSANFFRSIIFRLFSDFFNIS